MKITGKTYVGICVVFLALFVVFFIYLEKTQNPLIVSQKFVLEAVWEDYKEVFITKQGRTMDLQQNNVTTSEGQSYSMLRAVWMNDKDTFDTVWAWTQEHLTQPDSNLLMWRYGMKSDGTLGVLTDQGGENSASDADTDIALALILAFGQWGEKAYLDSARAIIADIWEMQVFEHQGTPYLLANDVEKQVQKETVIINPSYLAPYTYRIFADVDPNHPWNDLAESSYDVLQESISSTLDKETSAYIPPDWVELNTRTGEIIPSPHANLTTDYGYEALRVPFRVALDWKWFAEPRAKETLGMMGFLTAEWEQDGDLNSVYAHDGKVVAFSESLAMYAGSLGYFMVADPDNAREVYETKIISLYDEETDSWENQLNYYDDNWIWFAIGLYNNLLPNLAAKSLAQ